MKLEFSIEDNEMLYDVLDGVFVSLLKHELKNSEEYLQTVKHHPDDVAMYKKTSRHVRCYSSITEG